MYGAASPNTHTTVFVMAGDDDGDDNNSTHPSRREELVCAPVCAVQNKKITSTPVCGFTTSSFLLSPPLHPSQSCSLPYPSTVSLPLLPLSLPHFFASFRSGGRRRRHGARGGRQLSKHRSAARPYPSRHDGRSLAHARASCCNPDPAVGLLWVSRLALGRGGRRNGRQAAVAAAAERRQQEATANSGSSGGAVGVARALVSSSLDC